MLTTQYRGQHYAAGGSGGRALAYLVTAVHVDHVSVANSLSRTVPSSPGQVLPDLDASSSVDAVNPVRLTQLLGQAQP